MNSAITLIQACLLGAAFLVALFYFGFGATRLLLPPPLREWRGLMMPLVGLALVVVWDYLALFFGINLTIATFLLLGIATAVNAAAVVQTFTVPFPSTSDLIFPAFRRVPLMSSTFATKTPRHEAKRKQNRWCLGAFVAGLSDMENVRWGLFAIALITFLAAIAPLVRYGYITIIGENWDYEFYLPLADALRTLPTSALAQAPANPLMNVILSRHILPLPMGFSYLQSTLDVLFRLDAFDSFAILLAVVRALGVVSAFVFFRATLKMSPRAALAASGLLGLNGLLLWATYWNFGLHLTSLALLPIALTFGVETLLASGGNGGLGRSGVRPLPLGGLFLAALNVTFHPTLIAALLPLAGLGLYVLVARRDRVRTCVLGGALIVLTVGLSFPTLFHIRDFLREYYGREPLATGLREFIPLTDAYGLSQYSTELVVGHIIPTPALYDLATRIWGLAAPVFLALALAASIFALWQLWRNPSTPWHNPTTNAGDGAQPQVSAAGSGTGDERRAVWYIVSGACVFYVAVFRLPFLHPYPYGFLKSLTLVSFVLIALAAEGISSFKFQIPNSKWQFSGFIPHSTRDRLFYVSVFSFSLLTIFTFAITLEQYFKPAPPFFNADDLQLRVVPQILPRGATVFLTDRSETQKIPMGLAAYALREFPLRGNVSTGYGDMNNAAVGAVYDYALLARGEDPTGRGYQATPLWSNGKFALYAKGPDVLYHRTVNTRMTAPDILTFTLGANDVVTGTQTLSSTVATRGVNIALASFVTQTVTLALGGTAQSVALTPGLSVYRIPQAQLPSSLTITSQLPPELVDAASVQLPHQLPRGDAALFVPWVELVAGGGGVKSNAPTMALLVRCTSANAQDLNVRCFVANPGGVTMRWEYVVRGTPKGTREDQELVRRPAMGSPRHMVDIETGAFSGQLSLRFDDQTATSFSSPKLKDGNYRGALEIFRPPPRAAGRDDVLVAQIDLYKFVVSKNGTLLTRESPPDPPLVIVQP